MGNVTGLTPSRTGIAIGPSRTGIAIGPSRTGIVIGPSRTGIVIGRLLNAQLRHMSVRLALSVRGGINNFYFGHRHAVSKLHNTVWFYKVRWSFPSHFPSLLNTLLMPVTFCFHFHFRSIAYLYLTTTHFLQ